MLGSGKAEAVRLKADHASSMLTSESGYPYTFLSSSQQLTGMAMNYTKIGKRLVVIAGSTPANKAAGVREPSPHFPRLDASSSSAMASRSVADDRYEFNVVRSRGES